MSEEKRKGARRSRRAVDASPENIEKFNRAVKAFAVRNATPSEAGESEDSKVERAAFHRLRGRL